MNRILRIGYVSSFAPVPFLVAVRRGWFSDAGLPIEPIPEIGWAAAMRRLVGGVIVRATGPGCLPFADSMRFILSAGLLRSEARCGMARFHCGCGQEFSCTLDGWNCTSGDSGGNAWELHFLYRYFAFLASPKWASGLDSPLRERSSGCFAIVSIPVGRRDRSILCARTVG